MYIFITFILKRKFFFIETRFYTHPHIYIHSKFISYLFKTSDENLNILHHPPTFKGPILFSFNAKNFFGKKKASIRVDQGEWSDKFSLDVAGSSGVVVCKANNMIYQVNILIYFLFLI